MRRGVIAAVCAGALLLLTGAVINPSITLQSLIFLASGTGATPRPVMSKLRDVVSVLDYGADPTGVADSTTAINNAITQAALLQGGSVYFPAGTYKVPSGISVPNNVNLIGTGMSSSIISVTNANWGVDFADVQDSGIQGIRINLGASALGCVRIHAGAVLTADTYITIMNMYCFASARTVNQIGVLLQSDTATAGVYHNNFYNVRTFNIDIAMKFASSVSNQGPNANTVQGLNTNGQRIGVLMQDGTDNIIQGIQTLGAAGAPSPIGIWIPGTGTYGTHNNSFWIDSEQGAGATSIQIDASTATNPNINNMFIGHSNDPTQILDNSGKTGTVSNVFLLTTQWKMQQTLTAGLINMNGRLLQTLVTPSYGTTITVDAGLGNVFLVQPGDGTAYTWANPGNAGAGLVFTLITKNTFGVLGAATFSANYKLGAAWTQPANGFSRSITFSCTSSTLCVETSRTAVDVAN